MSCLVGASNDLCGNSFKILFALDDNSGMLDSWGTRVEYVTAEKKKENSL
jgi:hypothetical protein